MLFCPIKANFFFVGKRNKLVCKRMLLKIHFTLICTLLLAHLLHCATPQAATKTTKKIAPTTAPPSDSLFTRTKKPVVSLTDATMSTRTRPSKPVPTNPPTTRPSPSKPTSRQTARPTTRLVTKVTRRY